MNFFVVHMSKYIKFVKEKLHKGNLLLYGGLNCLQFIKATNSLNVLVGFGNYFRQGGSTTPFQVDNHTSTYRCISFDFYFNFIYFFSF